MNEQKRAKELMHTLINQLNNPVRYAKIARDLNSWAAIVPGGLIESQVRGQPYVGFNALVLSQSEQNELARLTETFGQIFAKALDAIVTDSTFDLSRLGWPAALAHPLHYEPPNRWLTPLGRFDFALDPHGHWQLLEFNSDTPSGAQEASLIEARSVRLLTRFVGVSSLTRINPDIGPAMARALLDEAHFAPVPSGLVAPAQAVRPPVIGFLARGRHLTDMAQVLYYVQALHDLNPALECIIGDPLNLTLINNRPLLLGKPLDGLYRLFPIEDFWRDPIFAAYTQANLNGSFKCLNNLRGFLAQSKAIMAWIWQARNNADLFDTAERSVIAAHLPPTYFIQDFAKLDPSQTALPASPVMLSDVPDSTDSNWGELQLRLKDFLVKEFFGREGAQVWYGADVQEAQWQILREAGNSVVQRKINIAPLPHFWLDATNQLQNGNVTPCIGSFLIGGKWGGCYSRVGSPITDSSAQFIPTLLDTRQGS